MNYLMGIKNCHSCNRRTKCTLKNSKENLVEKPLKRTKFAKKTLLLINVVSFCKDFGLEGKK